MNVRLMISLCLMAMATSLGGCAAVDAGGRMVSGVGQNLTDYGAKNDNGLAKTGGTLYTDIGAAIQRIAGKKPATATPPAAAAAAPTGNRTGTDRVEGK